MFSKKRSSLHLNLLFYTQNMRFLKKNFTPFGPAFMFTRIILLKDQTLDPSAMGA